jgi:rubrerythrin
MNTPTIVSPSSPVDDLLSLAGASGNELARRMGRASSYGNKARNRGGNIHLATLIEIAEALDLDLEIRATRKGAPGDVAMWCGECGATWTQSPTGLRCPKCGEVDELERTDAREVAR